MINRRHPGLWLPLILLLVWGLWVLIMHQDTARENAFTLLMYVGLASSLNILLGYTGFYFLSQHGWPLYGAALMGGALSSFLAGLLGLAVLRLRGAYFALATIGINEAARAFVNNFAPFGGSTGLFVNFSVYQQYGGAGKALWTIFTFLWVITMVVMVVSFFVKHSRLG